MLSLRILVTAALATCALPAAAANLIKNGSFETPPSPQGSYAVYAPGQTIGPWTVVGASGNVATVYDYNEGGVTWSAHQGKAFLDLTGTCDCGAPSGVSQTVKTTAGQMYKLTFWVGNTYISGQGLTSTVDAYIGQKKVLSATNKAGKGSAKEVWHAFSVTFVAKAATTTLSFINADPSGDQQNGLDSVTLVAE